MEIRNRSVVKRLVFGIASLCILSFIAWLIWVFDPYWALVNKHAQEEQALIDEYFWASHVDDIPTDERTVFHIAWHGSNAKNRAETQVRSVVEINPKNSWREDPSVHIALWLDESRIVQHAVVCFSSPDDLQLAHDIIPHVVKLLGVEDMRVENELRVILPRIDPSSWARRPTLSREHWSTSKRLVRGDKVSVPADASLFVREVTMSGLSKSTPVWFYWFADSQGRILGARMVGT